MAGWRRVTRIAGLTVGAAAGGAAAGVGAVLAAERIAASRLRPDPDPALAEPLGELRGRELVVEAADGVPLHVEVNGPSDAPVTVIFSHGYALHQDSWHYQRRDLAGQARLVFWDQRGHGRSGQPGNRADGRLDTPPDRPADSLPAVRAAGQPAGRPVTIGQTGSDLHAVLSAVAPAAERVILVGHSMGGMSIMALASQHPELFGSVVAGVILIGTAAGGLSSPDGLVPWMPSPLRTVLQRAAPGVLRGAAGGRRAALVERGRKATRELEFIATRFLAFGDPWMSMTVTDFLERMIRQAPVGVIAEFYGALLAHDARDVPGVLARVPVTVIVGDKDRLIPPRLGIELAEAIEGARLAVAEGAGHVVILERPDLVNEVISGMIAEVESAAAGQAGTFGGGGGVQGVA